jgi:hypothetical protein
MVSSDHFTSQYRTIFITQLSFPLSSYTRSTCSAYGWQGIKHSPTELCPHQESWEYTRKLVQMKFGGQTASHTDRYNTQGNQAEKHNYRTFYHEFWSLVTEKTARAET